MKTYYHARAHEYDEWWLGEGLYADRDRPGWEEELEQLCVLDRWPAAHPDGRRGVRHGLSDAPLARRGRGEVLHAGRWFVVVRA